MEQPTRVLTFEVDDERTASILSTQTNGVLDLNNYSKDDTACKVKGRLLIEASITVKASSSSIQMFLQALSRNCNRQPKKK
ncbi:unnamed protein product [Caenorhabditis sp. 36 PRJEB53466]|nr:unnamed protein product [Caenorhabditis sp. 36 PRJEB53466]